MMLLHQVVIRKDGPIHAIEFWNGRYDTTTLCGMPLSGLERPKRRKFDHVAKSLDSCGRCAISYHHQLALIEAMG